MLDTKSLKNNLDKLTNPKTCPKTKAQAAEMWAEMYHSYVKNSMASTMKPTGLSKNVIKNILLTSTGSNFISSMSKAIEAYWVISTWSGPGFTGKISLSSGFDSVLNALKPSLLSNKSQDNSFAKNKLYDAITNHTKTIVVTMTNVSSGATSPVNLS